MQAFRALLGEAYLDLPQVVQDFHDRRHDHWRGKAFSDGAQHIAARALRRVFGFPEQGAALPVEIWLDQQNGRDQWRRQFGARRFASSFAPTTDGVLDERFGPFRFGFRLRAEADRMHWDIVRWGLGPLPLPKALGPRIETYETCSQDGAFEFYSHADFLLIGRLVHYHGQVKPVTEG